MKLQFLFVLVIQSTDTVQYRNWNLFISKDPDSLGLSGDAPLKQKDLSSLICLV